MKNTIIFAILTLFFIGAEVFPQTGAEDVLVSGNPPLKRETIDKSADFFQWALGGNFSAEESAEYRRQLIRIWEEKDTASINVIGEIVSMRDKLVNVPPEKLKTLVPDLQSGLLKELRAQPNDGLSRVLLKMYERNRGGVKPDINQAPPAIGNGADLSALVGEWEENYSGNSDFSTGTNGGAVRSSDRAKNIVRFYPDGSYKSAFINESRVMDNCRVSMVYVGVGVFSFDATTLHLNEKTRRQTSRSCFPLDNYEKDLPAGNYHYPWQLGRDEKGLRLVLTVDGKPHVFYRVEGAGVFGGA